MKCSRCGADLSQTAKFCRKCGLAVSETAEPRTEATISQQSPHSKFCRKCGTKLLPNHNYCHKCGTAIPSAGDLSRPSSLPAACTECGAVLTRGASQKFCTKCGALVRQEEDSRTPTPVQQEPSTAPEPVPQISSPETSTVTPQVVNTCKRCGSELKPNAKFCTKCGAAFFKPDVTAKTIRGKKDSDAAAEKAKIKVEQIYGKPNDTCFQCGHKLPVNSSDCPDCGAKRVICQVCKRNVNHADKVGACPFCENQFHYAHLRETVKVTGKCPMCKSPLKQHEIEEKKTSKTANGVIVQLEKKP